MKNLLEGKLLQTTCSAVCTISQISFVVQLGLFGNLHQYVSICVVYICTMGPTHVALNSNSWAGHHCHFHQSLFRSNLNRYSTILCNTTTQAHTWVVCTHNCLVPVPCLPSILFPSKMEWSGTWNNDGIQITLLCLTWLVSDRSAFLMCNTALLRCSSTVKNCCIKMIMTDHTVTTYSIKSSFQIYLANSEWYFLETLFFFKITCQSDWHGVLDFFKYGITWSWMCQ